MIKNSARRKTKTQKIIRPNQTQDGWIKITIWFLEKKICCKKKLKCKLGNTTAIFTASNNYTL